MSANGMNYPMYNTMTYPQIAQQQTLYEQRFAHPRLQPQLPQYSAYQMYPAMPTQAQLNSYDHIIRSAAETLAAFSHPSEPPSINMKYPSRHSQPNITRRSVTNPASAMNSIRTYYCETCRIACGGYATYQAHLNGSKHKKKELSTKNPTSSVNTQTKSTVNNFRCELCDISCTSSDAYKAHLDGSKHDKAMKLHRRLGKTIPSVEPPVNNQGNDSQAVAQEDKPPSESIIKPIGEEYIETTYDDTRKPILFHCKLCNCKFNDANAKDAHLKGKRHRLSYRRKVNPNFQIENNNNSNNNKSSSPKQQRSIETTNENPTNRPMNTYQPSEIDDDTRCLMTLHEQIIPTPNLLNAVEQFVSTVEAALKSCSDQLRSLPPSSTSDHPSETVANASPLMGVSRIGSLAKSLMIKTDRLFHIVVICTEWPTVNLFENISTILFDKFPETWRNRIEIQCRREEEIIEVQSLTDEGILSVSIQLTSMSMQQQEQPDLTTSEQRLNKTNCLNALNAMHSARWFQNHISTRQHAPALIRCLRYKTKISSHWQTLSSEAIEILIEYTLSNSGSAAGAFRRVLEYLAGGLVLSNGPGLRLPWQNNSIKDVFDTLTDQDRNNITSEAQVGLRLLAFGQLTRWLEQYDLPHVMTSFPKRSYLDDNIEVSVKRQCIE